MTNAQRVANYEVLRPVISSRLRGATRAEWVARMKAAGVPCGSVRTIAEVVQDEQVQARDMVREVEHAAAGSIRVLGVPIKLSDTPGSVRTAPPTLGEHTDRVLREDLGMSSEEIVRLRAEGAIE
jgi:crotonobetainyl-CoA:carnitine CoA-transferase CaiB-like acyl-CoA transferase